MDTLYFNVAQSGVSLTRDPAPALAQIALTGNYVFDNNAELVVRVTDTKEVADNDPLHSALDPLHGLAFNLIFKDKIDGSVITTLTGRLYTGGGIDALEENYSHNLAYIAKKLDFYGALDSEFDFFDVVETYYEAGQVQTIRQALEQAGVMNTLYAYRTREVVFDVPASPLQPDISPTEVRNMLTKFAPHPNYIAVTDVSNLEMIDALAGVMADFNIHMFIDVGQMTDWRNVAALVEGLNFNDQRIRVLWNPNKCRPGETSGILSRQKWRPCVGDYLGKHLLRNALRNVNGIPPLHIPVAGYEFPIDFRGMKQMDEVNLDEEAQNALAAAHVIVVLNERYQNQSRWIYGDVLTQRSSATSALRLANAAEIETFTANGVIDIIKRHMLAPMDDFLSRVYGDCQRFLDACVAAGLLKESVELAGRYYALEISPNTEKPFEAVNVKLARRPEGAVRQAYLETTIVK